MQEQRTARIAAEWLQGGGYEVTTGVGGTGEDAGSWRLVKNGAGTTILTGANAYSGGTTINAGVLQGTAISLPGSILDNAALVFNQAVDGTHDGAITKTERSSPSLTSSM